MCKTACANNCGDCPGKTLRERLGVDAHHAGEVHDHEHTEPDALAPTLGEFQFSSTRAATPPAESTEPKA